jgi:hypothetical protein
VLLSVNPIPSPPTSLGYLNVETPLIALKQASLGVVSAGASPPLPRGRIAVGGVDAFSRKIEPWGNLCKEGS